jgi:hypothetical protein
VGWHADGAVVPLSQRSTAAAATAAASPGLGSFPSTDHRKTFLDVPPFSELLQLPPSSPVVLPHRSRMKNSAAEAVQSQLDLQHEQQVRGPSLLPLLRPLSGFCLLSKHHASSPPRHTTFATTHWS